MASEITVSTLMAGYTPEPEYEGWVTNDDWVLALGITGEESSEKDYVVAQMGVVGLDAQLNPVTQEKQYIRAGQSTQKTGTQRTFAITGDRYIGDKFQDHCFSHKILYGTGQSVIVPYVYFNVLNGKGEKGTCSIIVESDGSGEAGNTSEISIMCQKVGANPTEYTYAAG